MFDTEKKRKHEYLLETMCYEEYQNSFFKPFYSFSDAKKNVKALPSLPIINLYCALENTLNALCWTTLGVANIAIGAATLDLNDLKIGGVHLLVGAILLKRALYHAVSIITDTLQTLVRLLTHSLATVALGIRKTGEAISECYTPSLASKS